MKIDRYEVHDARDHIVYWVARVGKGTFAFGSFTKEEAQQIADALTLLAHAAILSASR